MKMKLFDFEQMIQVSADIARGLVDEDQIEVSVVDNSGTFYGVADVKWSPVDRTICIEIDL